MNAHTAVRHEVFRSSFKSWQTLFDEAAAFATTVGRERLIGISHSCDGGQGVIAVWYWGDAPDSEG